MNICIYGAGAIGCWIAAHLYDAGFKPSLVARGDHLKTLQQQGLRITEGGTTRTLVVQAYGDQDYLPPQDVVIVTLKAHSITAALDHLRKLMHKDTVVLFGVNGVPWWFFHGLSDSLEERTVKSVDPTGRIWDEIGPERALGCVIYPAAELTAPGNVTHISGNRVCIGEPNAPSSERAENLSDVLEQAGIKAPIRRNIRHEIWIKLWGNVAFNPLSVLTGATLDRLATDPGTQEIARRLMTETQAVGSHFGAKFGMSIQKRIDGAASVGAHKTSMLQDYLQGKPLESDAVLGAVIELAEIANAETPTIRMMQALLAMKLANE